MKPNPLKQKLSDGKVIVGTFLFSSSPVVMEILDHAGLDFVIIDTEHGPTGTVDTQKFGHLIRAAESAGVVPLVRIPERSRIMTQKVLDLGAMGVVVPMVETAEEVEEIVKDCRYPPAGNRGACYLTRAAKYSAGFTGDYWEKANENIMVIPLVESKTAVENIEKIVQVEGVDFAFFGGRDYSMKAGYNTVQNPETQRAIKHTQELCEKYNVPLARFLYPPFSESVKKAVDDGARVLVAGGDVSLLYSITSSMVKALDEVR
ncbi:MAG: aldolase/citrate lyase family protein [Candidatus Bathyarchaeota archaeon]|nr:aldolase/citrate lyase family protein [Candidatus Bathyarchaeota archaeon]